MRFGKLAWGIVLAMAAGAVPARAQVDVIRDLEYPSPGALATCPEGPCNRLDLYLPTDGPPVATVLYVHGGGWGGGRKEKFSPGLQVLAAGGYAAVSIDYTLATEAVPAYPQAVYDVKAAVRWIRTTGTEKYRLPSRIIAMGTSAGGHLAMLIGTTAGVEIFEPLPPPPGGYRVDAMVSMWGVADLSTLDRPAVAQFLGAPAPSASSVEGSPLTWASASDPPAAFFHGVLDGIVPIEQSERMHKLLLGHGVFSRIERNPDAGHGVRGFGGPVAFAEGLLPGLEVLLRNDHEPADIDNDGDVDRADLDILLAAWGPCPIGGCPSDLDGDGQVGFPDVVILFRSTN